METNKTQSKVIKISLIIALAFTLIVGMTAYGQYNGFVTAHERVSTSQANIQSQLEMRFDKINQMVAVVERNLDHESDLLKSIAALRSNTPGISTDANGDMVINGSLTPGEIENISGQLKEITTQVNLSMEQYPVINQQLSVGLMDEIASAESQLNFARREYNTSVESYNLKIRRLPGKFFAGMFGFEVESKIEAPADAQGRPNLLGDGR